MKVLDPGVDLDQCGEMFAGAAMEYGIGGFVLAVRLSCIESGRDVPTTSGSI